MRFKLFGFGKKKKKKNPLPEEEEFESLQAEREAESAEVEEILKERIHFEKENVDLKDSAARIAYLERLRDTILEARRQCDDVKFEYGRVTSYLKDIQLIDQAPDDERAVIYDSAKRIVELSDMRKAIRHKRYRITEPQRKALDTFEDDVTRDIEKLLEYEDLQVKIRADLRRLSAEKKLLADEKQDIIRKQKSLRTISKAVTVILVLIACGLGALLGIWKVDIAIPFVASAAFAFLVVALIMAEARRNRMDMVITERKQAKAVALTNRVKIKYVNNVRTLDYLTAKYRVRNATELDFVYSQYREAKREWARQREGTIQIEENHEILIEALRKLGVRDREIWFSQAKALIDPSEMVEVRHELNQRRGKLREQLDYNTGVMTECLNEMDRIRSKKSEYEADVERVLSQMDFYR
ncbi:MAG: hypothetical protein IKQ97_08980 [Eubacterium sp.]|nr:hypothetical protein [Eubacterium sp.]